MGSPLAAVTALRGLARCFLGHSGWREDLDRAVAMARATDPLTHVLVVAYKYVPLIPGGALVADETAMREIDEALKSPKRLATKTPSATPKWRWASRWCIDNPRIASADWTCSSVFVKWRYSSAIPRWRCHLPTYTPHASKPDAETVVVHYRYAGRN